MKATNKQYAKALLDVTKGKEGEELKDAISRFSQNIFKMRQGKKLPGIIEKFHQLHDEESELVRAEVITARKADEEMLRKIESFIKDKYNAQEVEVINTVNSDIKGGVVIRVGDEVLDGSIKSKVGKLKQEIRK